MKSFLLSVIFFVAAAIGFYWLQNSGALPGGTVPVAKTAWLFSVIFYWFVLPFFWSIDKALPRALRMLFVVALSNMVIRALFELPMMYVTKNWLHVYGIGHDIASIALCIVLLVLSMKNVKPAAVWVSIYFGFSSILFITEAIFANYLRRVTDADGTVFFLPSGQIHSHSGNQSVDDGHNLIIMVTTTMVIAIFFMSLFLVSKWRTAEPAHRCVTDHVR